MATPYKVDGINNLGHITSQYKLGDIQRDYLFAVEFELPSDVQQYAKNAKETLTLCIRSAPIPGSGTTAFATSNWMGMEQFFAMKTTPNSNLTFNFEEFEGYSLATDSEGRIDPATAKFEANCINILKMWHSLNQNIYKDGLGKPKRSVVGKVRIIPLNADLSVSQMGIMTLHSVQIESVGDFDMGYSSGDAVKPSVQIKFDYPTIEVPNAGQDADWSNTYAEVSAIIKKFFSENN